MKQTAILALACLMLTACLAIPASAASDAQLMVGIWRGQAVLPNGTMTIETILYPNGSFSTLTTSRQGIDTHALRTVGRWYIVRQGWYRQHNDDWSPLTYKGKRIHMPRTESHQYRFLDRNRIQIDGNVIMYRVP